MTQEDRELLLKDLCARLPYGVKAFDDSIGGVDIFNLVGYDGEDFVDDDGYWYRPEDCKPYLFPLSSMTKEQKKEYRKICELDTEILSKHPMDGSPFPALYNSQDWLNAHHFDYRDLIPKGLAIDAIELNIY